MRRTLLEFDWSAEGVTHVDDSDIWSHPDCGVFGCDKHLAKSRMKGAFELHEIFKSLPSVGRVERAITTKIHQEYPTTDAGIWDIADDVLSNVLAALGPLDLVRIGATCRHLRSLAVPIMPCTKLTLFPHQEAAVEWMLKREHHVDVLPHPLYVRFDTEDGFSFYVNVVSSEIITGATPIVNDFHGGMFCDEPGLGKTVTALSLILKTHGTLADPPPDADVVWCTHDPDRRCGYYELTADNFAPGSFVSTWKRYISHSDQKGKASCSGSPIVISSPSAENSRSSRKRGKSVCSEAFTDPSTSSRGKAEISSCTGSRSMPAPRVIRSTRSSSRVKRNLPDTYDRSAGLGNKKRSVAENVFSLVNLGASPRSPSSNKKPRKNSSGQSDLNETWVQCDSCRKWRKLPKKSIVDMRTAWFCSMHIDPTYRSCKAPQELWDHKHRVTSLPGFYTKGTKQGIEENVTFFTNVLKEHFMLFNSHTKKALTWLSVLSENILKQMETVGVLTSLTGEASGTDGPAYYKIFRAFGLVRKADKGRSRWYYPGTLENLEFDTAALKIALTKKLDLFRLYLSRATLIVVPANLVDHWKSQIQKHVRPGQLRTFVWTDNKKPCAHILAWDYDIVITTFSRLSAEWGPRKKSILMQVHWLRIMLDEGHTLGSSLSLTNKLQMAINLPASNRWVLTGTPTPNTPSSQVSHLQPMLKFLHEEPYGRSQKSWDSGIVRPFEAQMEEGRARLLELLQRTMISARKSDLKNLPPCIKKVTKLHFTEEHAKSYNELVVTVRRNILMADWNDPSHVESLLNPKQWKLRSNTIRNVRLSCCVAGHIKVTDAGQDIQETMDILVGQGLDPLSEEYAIIRISILDGCCCFRCKEWCRLPVITPCRHLLCLDCVAQDSEKCVIEGCGNPYEMQSPDNLTRPENPNPKWPVPKDLIELQPSYKQDDWDPDWQSTTSSKVSYLIGRLKDLNQSNRKNAHCTRIINNSSALDHESATLPDKVIIFSQFLEHINVIEEQLTIAGIKYGALYSPLHSHNKMKSLISFQEDENCMALLMDGSAALGLDLSFVTHVFLMEPIWDRSMEEQVISRAHRMGATRPIYVETLAMRGTIEEQMVELIQDGSTCGNASRQDISDSGREGSRPRTLHDFAESNYLAQLSFVKTSDKA